VINSEWRTEIEYVWEQEHIWTWEGLSLYKRNQLPNDTYRKWNQIAFKNVVSILNGFISIQNSVRMLYYNSLLTESYASLKSISSWCTVPLNSYFLSSISRMRNIWSVVDRLRRNPYWLSPKTLSTCGVELDIRMLNKMYAVGNSGIPL
jgi:hypothetical protein